MHCFERLPKLLLDAHARVPDEGVRFHFLMADNRAIREARGTGLGSLVWPGRRETPSIKEVFLRGDISYVQKTTLTEPLHEAERGTHRTNSVCPAGASS